MELSSSPSLVKSDLLDRMDLSSSLKEGSISPRPASDDSDGAELENLPDLARISSSPKSLDSEPIDLLDRMD
jgi:hypothetical protein